MKLSKGEITKIIDYLSGKKVLSRRKEFEQFSSGRGRMLHRHALLYRSVVREIEKNSSKLKAALVDLGSDEPLLILENPSVGYRRETRIPKEIASYLVNKFPQIVCMNSLCSLELGLESRSEMLKRVQHDNAHSE